MKKPITLFLFLLSLLRLYGQHNKLTVSIQSGFNHYALSNSSNNSWNPTPDKWGTNLLIDVHYRLSKRVGLCMQGGYYTNELNKVAIKNNWDQFFLGEYNKEEKGYKNPEMFTILAGPSVSVGKKLRFVFIPYFGLCFQQAANYAVDYSVPGYNFTFKNSYKVDAKTNFIVQPTLQIRYDVLQHWQLMASASSTILNKSFGTYYMYDRVYLNPSPNTYASSDIIAVNLGIGYRL